MKISKTKQCIWGELYFYDILNKINNNCYLVIVDSMDNKYLVTTSNILFPKMT